MAEAAVLSPTLKADKRLIVPLDFPTADEARAVVTALGDAVSFYKVGLELFATDGMALARELKAQGKQVFLEFAEEEKTHLDLLMREFRALRERQVKTSTKSVGAVRRTAKRR